jgi:hypothetical protein
MDNFYFVLCVKIKIKINVHHFGAAGARGQGDSHQRRGLLADTVCRAVENARRLKFCCSFDLAVYLVSSPNASDVEEGLALLKGEAGGRGGKRGECM